MSCTVQHTYKYDSVSFFVFVRCEIARFERSCALITVVESQANWTPRISTFHNDMIEATPVCRFSTWVRHSKKKNPNKPATYRVRWHVSCSVRNPWAHVVETCRRLFCTIESTNRKRTRKIHPDKCYQIHIRHCHLAFSIFHLCAISFQTNRMKRLSSLLGREESPSDFCLNEKKKTQNIFSRSLSASITAKAIQLLHVTASLHRS